MKSLFVPFSGGKPKSVTVNGHRLLILSPDKDTLQDGLTELGGDSVKRIRTGPDRDSRQRILNKLARKIDGGIVLAPSDTRMSDVIRSLESELPWLQ